MAKMPNKPAEQLEEFEFDDEPDYAPVAATTGYERWLMVPASRLADLLRALVALGGDAAFPSEVAVTMDRSQKAVSFGVQLQLEDAERLKKQFFPGVADVRIEFAHGVAVVRPLREVIRPRFTRVDLAAEANALRPAQKRAFLFAANNEAQAKALLAELVAGTTPGIRVRPLSDSRSPSRFHSLWLVEGRHPSRSIFDCADRVWWTSSSERDRGNPVFLPYPYRSDLSREDLDRIDWNVANGFVLLNLEESPDLIVITEGAPPSLPLLGVTGIQVDPRPATVSQPRESAGLQFDVALRLVARDRVGSPNARLLERIRQLELDIDQRRQLVDRLSSELTLESESLPALYTPLFVYHEEAGQIPAELRRLVVEWADQKALRELRYARIRAESLPVAYRDHGDLHLLLTPTGLMGRPEQDGRDLWLREYAPTRGYRFDLQPDWVEFGLRLFLPDDSENRLELYPEIDRGLFSEMRPGEMVAERLGHALCPEGTPSEQIFLMLPGEEPNSPVTAIRVPKSAFGFLVESFPWKCGVVVPDRPVEFVEQDLQRMAEAFVNGVDEAFRGAIQEVGKQRIEQRQADFLREIQAVDREFDTRRLGLHENRLRFDREFAQRQEGLEALRKRLTHLDELLTSARQIVGNAILEGAQIRPTLLQLQGDVAETQTNLQQLVVLNAAIRDLIEKTSEMTRKSSDILKSPEGQA